MPERPISNPCARCGAPLSTREAESPACPACLLELALGEREADLGRRVARRRKRKHDEGASEA